MQIVNEFDVASPADAVWRLLTDIERISPCIPGFALHEIEGDEYRGLMAIKVGAVTARYACRITLASVDEDSLTAVLNVSGSEVDGQGGVEAQVRARLYPAGVKTRGVMTADVAVSGRLARFGRNLLSDVSSRLTRQFVRSVEERFINATTA